MTAHLTPEVRGLLSADALGWLDKPPLDPFIDGNWRTARSDTHIEVVDPGTGTPVTSYTAASAGDVADAVAAARAAFDDGRWSELDPETREEKLRHLADLLAADAETVAQLEALDTGKTLAEARLDIDEAVAVLRYYAGWATKVEGSVIPAPRRYMATGTREAIGVCAAITPWNYPLPILMYKLAPALAFGNTFVAKPSEQTVLSTAYLAQLCAAAGIPDGVVNVAPGAGATGAALTATPGIDKIAFTGSTRTGQAVMRAAADTLTKVSLELGGKSPQLVFADADLDAAIAGVMAGIWTNAGQVCIAGSRLIVDRRIHDEFVAELADRTRRLSLGHGLAPTTTLGPLISSTQRDRVNALIEQAAQDGAHVETAAELPDRDGYFIAPTIVTGARPGQSIEREEVFGPVLTVLPFDTEDEAVRLANDSAYGLASAVWSQNASRVHRVARRLRAGTVWANTYGVFHPTLPFGGVKASGFGRELGSDAVEHYTELKTTVIDL
ncbi:aldehyde dehydrogenase family protein [Streptomyces himalayensis]|uniref:Aldehyde dehydrogenase family protein n=1 Tax=Streptomyces himalayensis subsp. himalayensis TaxID=2756131 RepID=A0A7W0DKH1_9ACTN|nr:aldehyde dehydrogenase family protein [Streptomyces himalayensis]MBA2946748.1 aldehyde dehydrogenase family protein [Streptomyces himalayensis subsp. himalayensis]